MRKMKNTGVSWCPLIPDNWNVDKVKNYFYISKEQARQEDPTILKLARSGVQVRDISTNEGQLAESYENYNPVQPGDLLLNPMDLYSGANCNVSQISGVISPAYVNLRAKKKLNPKYFDYYFKVQYWTMAMFAHGKGVSFDNRWTINAEGVKNYELPIPSLAEQNAIVDRIEAETMKVDSLVGNQEAQIEKLKAYKQSLITEVVTRGIDSNVPLKESGIMWIGKMPLNWKAIKFKYVASVKSNLVDPANYPSYIQVSPENIEKGSGKLSAFQTVAEVGVESNNHLFYKGQILYSKVRPVLNKVAIAPFDGLCSADMYPIETSINSKYLVYAMLSDVFLMQVKLVTENRVKMPKINQEEIAQIYIACPPEEEQERIVEYLDEKMAAIDKLIEIKQKKIDKLNRYKKSFIYEYVTGKKEVVC